MKATCIIAAMAVSGTILPAHADDTHFYVGGGIGRSHVKIDEADSVRSFNDEFSGLGLTATAAGKDENDTAYRAFLGYRLHRHLALELAYQNWGKVRESIAVTGAANGTATATFQGYGVQLAALGILPLTDSLEVFGKAGANFWSAKASASVSLSGVQGEASESDSGVGAVLGVGASFALTDALRLRAEWDHLRGVGKDDTTGKADINAVYLSLQYSFH